MPVYVNLYTDRLPAHMKRVVRNQLRRLANAVALALTSPLWLIVLSFGPHCNEQWFVSCGQLLSLIPGRVGVFSRRGFYRMVLEQCGSDAYIEFGTWFAHRQASLGKGVYIGGRCTLGMVSIGDHTLIGSNVDVLSGGQQHAFENGSQPMAAQGGRFRRVSIGRDCWLGNSSVIMSDVAEHCVIGAGSVVVKPIPGWSIAVGNPARVIRSRLSLCDPTHEDAVPCTGS